MSWPFVFAFATKAQVEDVVGAAYYVEIVVGVRCVVLVIVVVGIAWYEQWAPKPRPVLVKPSCVHTVCIMLFVICGGRCWVCGVRCCVVVFERVAWQADIGGMQCPCFFLMVVSGGRFGLEVSTRSRQLSCVFVRYAHWAVKWLR